MKNVFIAMMFTFLSLILMCGSAYAVAGECSNCHTMHNSQNGASIDPDGIANAQLLNAGCVGCHTGPHDTLGKNALGAPVVLDSVDPTGQGGGATNAGGDFWWVTQASSDAKGHNVADITGVAVDTNIGETPPGWDPGATTTHTFGPVAGGAVAWGSQLTCAGEFGCHGVRSTPNSLQAISGSHHNNADTGGGVSATQASTADTIGNSYRFLAEIKGLEQAEWNFNETAASHNEYYGIDFQDTERDDDGLTPSQVYPSGQDTISYFCAQCHGNFHSEIDDDTTHGSPWRRHPTDIVLPGAATEYARYNNDAGGGGAGDYDLEVPVARPVVPATSTNTVVPADSTTADGAIVMCLSCHRAHGSPEDDMLRWTYSTMTVGSGPATNDTGCFVCHNDKN